MNKLLIIITVLLIITYGVLVFHHDTKIDEVLMSAQSWEDLQR